MRDYVQRASLNLYENKENNISESNIAVSDPKQQKVEKRGRRSSYGRRVSFSNTVDVRRFYPTSDSPPVASSAPSAPSSSATASNPPSNPTPTVNTPSLNGLLSRTSYGGYEEAPSSTPSLTEVIDASYNNEDTTSIPNTPSLTRLLGRQSYMNVEDTTNLSKTPSLTKLLGRQSYGGTMEDNYTKDLKTPSLNGLLERQSYGGTELQIPPTPSLQNLLLEEGYSIAEPRDSIQQLPSSNSAYDDGQTDMNITQTVGSILQTNDVNMEEDHTEDMNITQTIPNGIIQKSSSDTSSSAENISCADFMYLADMRFLDDFSVHRKPSLGIVQNDEPKTLRDILEFTCLLLPELDIFEWGCDQLKQNVTDSFEQISQVEQELTRNNPAVFNAIRSTNKGEVAVLKEQLKQLRDKCSKEGKNSWYEWRVKLEQNMTSRLSENLELLTADSERLHKYLEDATQQLAAIKEEKEQFVQSKKQQESSEQDTTTSLLNTSGVICADSTASGAEEADTLPQQEDIVTILSGLSLVKLVTLTTQEIMFHMNKEYFLHLVLGSPEYTHQKFRPITHRAFGCIPGTKVDEIVEHLVMSANIQSTIDKLENTSQLREVLTEVSHKMSRIATLKKELQKLERAFTIRRSTSGHGVAPTLQVEFSNSKTISKFFVNFQFHAGYPFGELAYTFVPLFGRVQSEDVDRVIASIPQGFSRFTKICDALKQL